MKQIKILIMFLLVTNTAFGIGLSVNDLIKDYNNKFGATWFNCSEVSTDFYNAISQNFQKANLQYIGIKTGKRNPLTESDGHAVITWTEGRRRFVISTWTDNKVDFYVKKIDVGYKSLHEVCEMFIPRYKFVKIYVKGFGFIPKSRKQLMMEGGHRTDELDDIWERTGKDEREAEKQRSVWSI